MPGYHVERTILISGPPERVYETVADFGTWTTWSPWLISEPDAEVSISEDPASTGSLYSWKGDIVGHGELEHRRLVPGQLIEDEIRFLKPMKSTASVSFEFEPRDSGTQVTWKMDGHMPAFMSWMIPMIQTFVGMDYERGLKMLKEWIETGCILSRSEIRGLTRIGPLTIWGLRRTASLKDCGAVMGEVYQQVCEQLPKEGAALAEAASVYHSFNPRTGIFDFTAGFVVTNGSAGPPAGYSAWSAPETQTFCVAHTGSYDHLGNPWSAAHQNVRARRLKHRRIGDLEIYLNNPDETPDAERQVEIHLPVRKKILGWF